MTAIDFTNPQVLVFISESVHEWYGPEADLIPLAAVGFTQYLWRNTEVEEAHAGSGLDRISDGEMFAANVSTTRLLREHLSDEPIDWGRLQVRLLDPQRTVGGRTARDLLDGLYPAWARTAAGQLSWEKQLERQLGREGLLKLGAFVAHHVRWWGTPDWPGIVERFREHVERERLEVRDLDGVVSALLEGPDRLSPEMLEWCVRNGIGYV